MSLPNQPAGGPETSPKPRNVIETDVPGMAPAPKKEEGGSKPVAVARCLATLERAAKIMAVNESDPKKLEAAVLDARRALRADVKSKVSGFERTLYSVSTEDSANLKQVWMDHVSNVEKAAKMQLPHFRGLNLSDADGSYSAKAAAKQVVDALFPPLDSKENSSAFKKLLDGEKDTDKKKRLEDDYNAMRQAYMAQIAARYAMGEENAEEDEEKLKGRLHGQDELDKIAAMAEKGGMKDVKGAVIDAELTPELFTKLKDNAKLLVPPGGLYVSVGEDGEKFFAIEGPWTPDKINKVIQELAGKNEITWHNAPPEQVDELAIASLKAGKRAFFDNRSFLGRDKRKEHGLSAAMPNKPDGTPDPSNCSGWLENIDKSSKSHRLSNIWNHSFGQSPNSSSFHFGNLFGIGSASIKQPGRDENRRMYIQGVIGNDISQLNNLYSSISKRDDPSTKQTQLREVAELITPEQQDTLVDYYTKELANIPEKNAPENVPEKDIAEQLGHAEKDAAKLQEEMQQLRGAKEAAEQQKVLEVQIGKLKTDLLAQKDTDKAKETAAELERVEKEFDKVKGDFQRLGGGKTAEEIGKKLEESEREKLIREAKGEGKEKTLEMSLPGKPQPAPVAGAKVFEMPTKTPGLTLEMPVAGQNKANEYRSEARRSNAEKWVKEFGVHVCRPDKLEKILAADHNMSQKLKIELMSDCVAYHSPYANPVGGKEAGTKYQFSSSTSPEGQQVQKFIAGCVDEIAKDAKHASPVVFTDIPKPIRPEGALLSNEIVNSCIRRGLKVTFQKSSEDDQYRFGNKDLSKAQERLNNAMPVSGKVEWQRVVDSLDTETLKYLARNVMGNASPEEQKLFLNELRDDQMDRIAKVWEPKNLPLFYERINDARRKPSVIPTERQEAFRKGVYPRRLGELKHEMVSLQEQGQGAKQDYAEKQKALKEAQEKASKLQHDPNAAAEAREANKEVELAQKSVNEAAGKYKLAKDAFDHSKGIYFHYVAATCSPEQTKKLVESSKEKLNETLTRENKMEAIILASLSDHNKELKQGCEEHLESYADKIITEKADPNYAHEHGASADVNLSDISSDPTVCEKAALVFLRKGGITLNYDGANLSADQKAQQTLSECAVYDPGKGSLNLGESIQSIIKQGADKGVLQYLKDKVVDDGPKWEEGLKKALIGLEGAERKKLEEMSGQKLDEIERLRDDNGARL